MCKWIAGVLILVFFNKVSAQEQSRLLTLQLDDVTVRPGFMETGIFKTFEGDLYYLNKISREIKVFSFQDGSSVKSIPLELSGPDAVGPDPNTFEILGKDSIVVHSDFFDRRLSLISEAGKVKDKYNLNDPDWQLPGMVSTSYAGLEYQNGKIFAARLAYDYEMLGKVSPVLSINLVDKKVKEQKAPLMYPNKLLSKVPKYPRFLSPSLFANHPEGEMGLSFPLDANVYVSKDGFLTYRTIGAGSQYIEEYDLLSTDIRTISRKVYARESRDSGLLSGRYLGMFYEPVNERYYRLVRLPYPKKKLRDYWAGTLKRLPPERYSVIVLDSSFKKVDEIILPEKEYDPERGAFIHDGGLWILKAEGESEDEMKFEFIKK